MTHRSPRDEEPKSTSAQQWAERANALIEAKGPDGLAEVLGDDFVQESRRVASLVVRREGMLGAARTMRDMGLHVSGVAVAVAGDLCILTRRSYTNASSVVELLAVSVWDEDGRLVRLIEFDVDALDVALAELARVAGEPAVLLPSASDG
jgi:hypothetical protein